jgi:TolB protein
MNHRSLLYVVAASCLLSGGLALRAVQAPVAPAPPAGAQASGPSGAASATSASGPNGEQVNLVLSRGQRPKIKIALPSYTATGLSGDFVPAGRELEDTVHGDLDVSSYFDIQGPDALRTASLTGDPQKDLPTFAALGNQVLLLGASHVEEDKLVFEGRMFDIGSGKLIMAKRYRGPTSVVRRMAHTFSDEVIHYLTGATGIALSTIAYTSDRTGFKEIFIMDYDGHNQRRVTGHRSTSMSPAWSPTGDAIAYTSFIGGGPGIFIADLASGRKRPLLTTGTFNVGPSFSPDGNQIAFAHSYNGNIDIAVADKDGGNMKRLTTSPAIDTNPTWSPKGSEIAFTSDRDGGNLHIYLMDAEGANQRRVTFESSYDDGAAWSPDGTEITYTSRRNGVFQIAVTNVASLETRVLTAGSRNESPAFSPDGRKIVFTSDRAGTKQLFMMDARDGANVKQLTEAGNNDLADWSRHTTEKQ